MPMDLQSYRSLYLSSTFFAILCSSALARAVTFFFTALEKYSLSVLVNGRPSNFFRNSSFVWVKIFETERIQAIIHRVSPSVDDFCLRLSQNTIRTLPSIDLSQTPCLQS